ADSSRPASRSWSRARMASSPSHPRTNRFPLLRRSRLAPRLSSFFFPAVLVAWLATSAAAQAPPDSASAPAPSAAPAPAAEPTLGTGTAPATLAPSLQLTPPDSAATQGTFEDVPATPPPADTAAARPQAPSIVGHISVQGNVATDSARIVRSFEVVPGSRFSLEAVQRGIHKLFALGLFADAWVERLPRGNEVDLVIHVVERPRIGAIEFQGNKKRE